MHLLGIACLKQSLASLRCKHSVQMLAPGFFQCLFCLSFFQLLPGGYGGSPALPQGPALCGGAGTAFAHSSIFLFGSVVRFRCAAKYRWLKRRRKG